MLLFLIFITTFAAVAVVVLYLGGGAPNPVRRRILEGATANELARQRSASGGPGQRLLRPAVQRLGTALSQLLPQNIVAGLERLLVRAGAPLALGNFLLIWVLVSAAGVVMAYVAVQGLAGLGWMRFVVAGLLVAYVLPCPYLLIRRRANIRVRRIEQALPDALDLMLTCVEAGLGVDASFALVVERSPGPLAQAFREYLKQVGFGRSRREALDDIATRSGAHGLKRLAVTVTQSTSVGTNMGDVLRMQAAELREARRLRAQEAAARAPILMTIPLALCFMPAMIAVVVVPALFNLIDFVGGGFGSQ